MKKSLRNILVLCFCFVMAMPAQAADPEKKVILQAFWWDYWNSNFENSYANYLTELAPRLRELDINAVWVPPFVKNTGTNSVGYSPFDFYDLGDKYQKGSVTTRFGTKDDVLRMIAVMHANGIEVIADAVVNHTVGAGGENNGAGGEDPNAWDDKWKNFRYVCYETPYKDGGQTDYWNRKGRWPKNWQNFHANEAHKKNDDDWTAGHWGPDNCFYEGAYGQSSNVKGYNPVQEKNYMRDQARDWIMWFKKQTAVDGFRWDAVKHYPEWAQQDFLYNVKYSLPDFAKGGEGMFSVGEFIGSKTEIDNYCMRVQYANGSSEFAMGGYDVPLRGAIKNGVIDGGGYGNIGSVVGEQIGMRYNDYGNGFKVHRSLNYINSHDTFRPIVDDKGNYKDWDGYNELGGHADPFNQRMGMAYATILAMDGNISVFMEDLFNLSNSNRYSHMPADEKALPVRDYLKNLIWCHQNLSFKYGDYKVRWQDEDLLVIERSGKAIIAITDDGANAHDVWIDTDFRNVQLKDYSGGTSGERTAWGDGRFNVRVTPADGNGGLGYAVWAPVIDDKYLNYAPYRSAVTTQEWEMADDLGDSHCNSLGQGGALPEKSCEQRLVGKIYVEKSKAITYNVYPEKTGNDVTFALYDLDGNLLHKKNGTKTITGTYTPTKAGWVAMKVWNTVNTNAGQKCWVNVAYQAPATVTNTMSDRADTRASIWTGNAGTSAWSDCGNWEQGKVPNANSRVVIPDNGDVRPVVSSKITIKELLIEKGEGTSVAPDVKVTGSLNVTGKISCGEGTAFICGTGKVASASVDGSVDFCVATLVDEITDDEFDMSVFPVPATDVLYVQTSKSYNGEIEVISMTGNKVLSVMSEGEEITEVPVSDLAAGNYLVRFGAQVKHFIKK
ncbi:MAG: DUF1939 domain-containing protein [Paludibacteraceae bacterium]|nr:DUF1939 domain-containing protein [Paludibacteraceae bacterium]